MDILGIIIAYNIKPKIILISTHDMIYADPCSRFYHYKKGLDYRKEFKLKLRDYKRYNEVWIPSNPQAPSHPRALKMRSLWEESLLGVAD